MAHCLLHQTIVSQLKWLGFTLRITVLTFLNCRKAFPCELLLASSAPKVSLVSRDEFSWFFCSVLVAVDILVALTVHVQCHAIRILFGLVHSVDSPTAVPAFADDATAVFLKTRSYGNKLFTNMIGKVHYAELSCAFLSILTYLVWLTRTLV